MLQNSKETRHTTAMIVGAASIHAVYNQPDSQMSSLQNRNAVLVDFVKQYRTAWHVQAKKLYSCIQGLIALRKAYCMFV